MPQKLRAERVKKEYHKYQLYIPYTGESGITVQLTLRENRGGLKPVKHEIVKSTTTVPYERAVEVIKDIKWIAYKQDSGREIPPVITAWDTDMFTIAACLKNRYKFKQAPFRRQFDSRITEKGIKTFDRDRIICWWPDREAWDMLKKAVKKNHISELALPFFTYSEFHKRSDVMADVILYTEKARITARTPNRADQAISKYKSMLYSDYMHRMRTTILFAKRNNIKTKIVLASTEKALDFFEKENLDPFDELSWALAVNVFSEMPKYIIEEEPDLQNYRSSRLRAAVSLLSYMPRLNPVPDALAALIFDGQEPVSQIIFWFNPTDIEMLEGKGAELFVKELRKRGIREIVMLDNMYPFTSPADSNELILDAPTKWLLG